MRVGTEMTSRSRFYISYSQCMVHLRFEINYSGIVIHDGFK